MFGACVLANVDRLHEPLGNGLGWGECDARGGKGAIAPPLVQSVCFTEREVEFPVQQHQSGSGLAVKVFLTDHGKKVSV